MKRVLVYGVSGGFGGIEAFLFNIISHINSEEIQFDILTYYDSIAYQDIYNELGVRIYKITSKHSNMVKNRMEMYQFFKEHAQAYDVLWCNLAELINIDILKMAKKFRIPKRIIHSHCVTSARNKVLTSLHYFNKGRIKRFATDFWACSYPAGEWFYNTSIRATDKFQIIRNAIETSKYVFDEKIREKIRSELKLEDAFIIGHAGRMSIREKNTIFLLDVFKEIIRRNPATKLLLVGDGVDRDIIEQKIDDFGIRNNTILLGYRDDINYLMSAMDIFLLPSKAEGLGIVLIEAQASGLPCFTSDKVVPKEVAITNLVQFIDLNKKPGEWAEIILDFKQVERHSRLPEIKKAGYDIEQEAQRVASMLAGEKKEKS